MVGVKLDASPKAIPGGEFHSSHGSACIQKKSPAQTGELENVNQGASTIPLFRGRL